MEGREADLLFEGVRALKGRDDETYQDLLEKLRDFTAADTLN